MFKFDTSALTDAIKAQVADIKDAVGENTLRAAGFAGAEVFRDEAQQNASRSESMAGEGPAKRTGTLHNNIIVKRLEEESDGGNRQAYLVTVRTGKFGTDGDAFYWRFVEEGHKFVPRNKKVSKKTGKTIGWAAHRAKADRAAEVRRLEFGSSGVPAYPFMRPAYESKKQEAVDAMSAKISEILKEKLGG